MTLVLTIGAALVLLVAAVSGWLAYQTLLQNGRILRRIERLEEETRAVRDALEEAAASERGASGDGAAASSAPHGPIAGWPSGAVVPDFELATPDGGSLTLWEWRGREVLLVFFDPACDASRELFARMGRLRPDAGGAVVLLIGTGDPERNRAFAAEHGLTFPVLVQEERELARVLRADGTPAAYRIDAEGRTVGERALGVAAVLALLQHAEADPAGVATAPEGTGTDYSPLHLPPVPTGTHIRRTGLHPGEPAPDFRLPAVQGGEHSLSEFLGRGLLLVFTDPHCGPCQRAMPELERVHRAGTVPFRVVAISRGGRDANLAHTEGITFPILLQRHWEVSRNYAMFATPVAYLIDEAGTIASPPALGLTAILDLVRGAATPAGAVPA
ncbi:hypothetical protein tb265_04910 [Gemmatimonadetes bacterium T265]|nr:hypothetical protein tb265_04910 [Gemmatimonadetes bacterium T265]